MNKSVLVPVSDGCEEIETVAIIDVLRRAGIEVTFASIKPITDELPKVTGRSGIQFICDTYMTKQILEQSYDVIALPGGLKNAEALSEDKLLIERLKLQLEQQKWIAAICASPQLVLDKHGFMKNQVGTCHPAHVQDYKGQFQEDSVVVSGKIITSRSPGTALEFSLAIVELLLDKGTAVKLAKSMLIRI
ncbi:hypothetical protein pb186bvf_021086 [Paramecium bursaria]